MIFRLRINRLELCICLGLFCLLAAACAPEPPANPLLEVGGLSRDMAAHLTGDTEAEFAAYSRQCGNMVLRNSLLYLNGYRREALALSDREYARRDSLLGPYHLRIARALAREYGLPEYQILAEGWVPLSPARKIQLEEINSSFTEASREHSLPLADRERTFLGILERVEDFKPCMTRTVLAANLANIAKRGGRLGDQRYYLDLAIAEARKSQKFVMLSQLLGELGSVHKQAGRPDSMRICYDEALAIAMRHRLPHMAGRIHEFYGNLYVQQGRVGLAKNSYDRAIEICREFKGGYWELRFLLIITKFHAETGCWDLVGRHLDRAEILERQFARCPTPDWVVEKSRELRRLRARWLMAKGKEKAGDRLYAELAASDWSTVKRTERIRLLKDWGEDRIRCRRPDEAIPLLEKGIRLCEVGILPEEEPRLWVLLARARLAVGDLSGCLKALTGYRDLASRLTLGLQEEWLLHDQTAIEASLADEVPGRTADAVKEALGRLREFLTGLDFSSESYLILGQAHRLRHLLLRLAQADPETGYTVEMLWRRAVSDAHAAKGTSAHPLDTCAELLASQILSGENPGKRPESLRTHRDLLRTMRSTHLCYMVGEEQVIRWVVTADSVESRTLDLSAAELSSLIEETRRRISQDPGGFAVRLHSGLQDRLQELGRILLPASLTHIKRGRDDSLPLLLITASGCLADFPFATLSIRGGAYRPLLADFDLAYLQAPLQGPVRPGAGPGLIVADPILSPEVSRWVGPLEELAYGQEEAFLLRELVPSARVLGNKGATKKALLDNWEGAPFIYFAAHTLRDPEEPYLSFIPLSVDRSGLPLEAALLDAADIRSARLGGCGLVVLSGCSSGRTFQGEFAAVPGLGAAFRAAGAGCVVQTLWDIRDEDAGRLMDPFLRAWAGDGTDPVRALGRAQREFMFTAPGVYRHPFSWGAYAALIRTSISPKS